MVLLLAPVLDGELLTNNASWLDRICALFDEMILHGQLQASSQKSELQHLQQVFCSIPYPLTESPDFPDRAVANSQPTAPNAAQSYGLEPDQAIMDITFDEDAIFRTDFTAEQLMSLADTLDLDGIDWMTTGSSNLAEQL